MHAQTSSENTHPDPDAPANAKEALTLQVMPRNADVNQPAQRPPGRLTVSILWFENRAGSQAEHWRHGIEGLLRGRLRRVKAIQLRGGIAYARRRLGSAEGSALNATKARAIGELVETQRVVWGSYQRRDDKWQVSVYLLNVATGEISDSLRAASEDWFDIRDSLTEQILGELRIRPSEEEKRKLISRETDSPQAFEWFVKAYALQAQGKPLAEREECARRAIAADPQYAGAYGALAAVLGTRGEFEQVEETVRKALTLEPDDAQSHCLLGIVFSLQSKFAQGQKELQEALRLEPDDAETLSRLAQLYAGQEKWEEAVAYGEKAVILAPMEASIHAQLGLAYANQRDRDRAMLELKEAQRLADLEGMDGMNAEQMICQAYHRLGEIPLAVEHYEIFVVQARKMGANPAMVNAFEKMAQRLKVTLVPTFIEAKMPEVHTEQTLQRTLQERLTKAELEMVVNPVAGSREIRRWARQLTQGASTELDKAKAIFAGLTRRIQTKGESGTRTACEVFAAWKDPNESFNCQEFTKLFLALAREVGVGAFYVHLGRDYRGKLVFHDCAIVFVEGKALLVDPAYRWFGVPHQAFVVLDDVQMLAHQLYQHTSGEGSVSGCRVAAKLHPDFAWGQLRLAAALWGAGRRAQAQEALEAAARLEPGRWDTCRLRGHMAVDDEAWDTAVPHLRKALELNPEDDSSHFLLGTALAGQGRQEEAREAYRASLTHGSRGATADWTRRAIVQINEMIGTESGQEYATAALMLAAEGGQAEEVRRMLAEGADVNAQETSGLTALMAAAHKGHADIVKLLLENNAEINAKNTIGGTALIAASAGGHIETARLLIQNGADVTVESKGQTALRIARGKGHADIVDLLTQALQAQLDAWVSKGMPISQDELLAYYEQVKAKRSIENAKLQFSLIDIRPANLEPAQIKAAEGETSDEAAVRIATELSERARKGEDLGELAKTYSHGHRRLRGGLWPPVTPGSLAPPYDVLEEHMRDMQIGQVSEPVQADGHVFILKLEQTARKNALSFDEVKDDLRQELQIIKRKKLELAMRTR